jgi:hypothetical protein
MRYGRSLAITARHTRLIGLIRAGEFSSHELARKLKVSGQTIFSRALWIDAISLCGGSVRGHHPRARQASLPHPTASPRRNSADPATCRYRQRW